MRARADALQRETASPEDAVRTLLVLNDVDVEVLLSEVTTPTLVLRCRDDAAAPGGTEDGEYDPEGSLRRVRRTGNTSSSKMNPPGLDSCMR